MPRARKTAAARPRAARKTAAAPAKRVLKRISFTAIRADQLSDSLEGICYRLSETEWVLKLGCGDEYTFKFADVREVMDALEQGAPSVIDDEVADGLARSIRGY